MDFSTENNQNHYNEKRIFMFVQPFCVVSLVGRSERSDLRHGNLNEIRHIGGRYTRSDMAT